MREWSGDTDEPGVGEEEIFEEIMVMHLPKLEGRFHCKWIHREVMKTYLGKKNKPIPRHIIVKPKNIRDKEKF